ncbi:hypothetical protein [Paenibacillus herberti]|uniref:Uncharacterized protein n=1 Tax=Paenibacillus herberti TaxID=1619309 RepID=A0A229NTJ4_9BACL|nr:hypothetical protein [Paenibacillus herberti]OXM13178.1 hypothetical protein CGZ75_23755 [Paenibacillus herberti]
MIKNIMIDLIRTGKYLEAESILFSNHNNYDEIESLILDIAYEISEITIYSFVSYLISKKETIELHGIAANLMITPLSFLDGAYSVALYHVKRALEIDELDKLN